MMIHNLEQPDLTNALIEFNTQSFIEAFRLETMPLVGNLLDAIMQMPARNITKLILEFDRDVNKQSLGYGSERLLRTFQTSVKTYNSASIPQSEPLLLVSNHPGMTDAMAIFASMGRQDIKVIAKRNTLLQLLNGINQHLIFVDESPTAQISTIRAATCHLKAGGTVVSFPAGGIEPDPALRQNAPDSLTNWSASIELFARYIPNLHIVPVAVGGVISKQALRNPLVNLYKTSARRDWVAATLMVMFSQYRQGTVSVRYGNPIKATSPHIMDEVRQQMHDLICQTWIAAQNDAIEI